MLATSLTAAVLGVERASRARRSGHRLRFPEVHHARPAGFLHQGERGPDPGRLRNCGYEFKWDRRITVSMAPASLRKMGSSYDLADRGRPAGRRWRRRAPRALRRAGWWRAGPGWDAAPGHRRAAHDADARSSGLARRDRARGQTRRRRPSSKASTSIRRSRFRRRWRSRARPCAQRPPRSPVPHIPRAALPEHGGRAGQVVARRALEIAAAGGHNLIFIGPPGSGKTMLAGVCPASCRPSPSKKRSRTTAIHSAWGARMEGLLGDRPFRSPHTRRATRPLVGVVRSPGPAR